MTLWLDAGNRLIAADEMFRGSLTQTSVHPREVVKQSRAQRSGSYPCVQSSVRARCRLERGHSLDKKPKGGAGAGGCPAVGSFHCRTGTKPDVERPKLGLYEKSLE